MRFAYIDSQGKEVSIPSADALRLRIELGAIVDGTEFFDSSTDRWAPAVEHEIYRTLKRELDDQGMDGFVAPPPSAIATPPAEVDELDLADLAPDPPAAEETSTPDPEETSTPDPEETSTPAPEEPEIEDLGLDAMELTPELLAPDPETPDPVETPAALEDADDFGMDMGDLTLSDEPVEAAADEAEEESDDFDMGGFGTLELEDDPSGGLLDEPAESEEAPPARWDVAAEVEGGLPLSAETEDSDFGGLEEGGLELDEGPGSWVADDSPTADVFEQDPVPDDAPPTQSWDQDDTADSTEDDAGWQDSATASSDSDEERPADPYNRSEQARVPRSAPPQRKLTPKASGGAGRLVGILLVLVVLGGGGWFGMQMMGGGADSPEVPEVALPDLPTELQPQLRQLAQRASARMVERFDSLPARLQLDEGPGRQWLGGVYLANASDYDQTAIYWREMGELVTAMKANERAFFEEAFRDEVEAANLLQDNANLLIDRGLAGFDAAAPDREIIYDQLQGVVQASTDLHLFLMQNEDDIDFEPAAVGTSRDPLLEAVPVTRALGDEMMSQVIGITDALDALGFLAVVETDPLLAVVGEKLVATGIR